MSRGHRDIRLFIIDIMESIQKIELYTHETSYEAFLKDDKTKDAVLRNLEVIGEAVRNLPESVKEKYPDPEWKEAAGMRDRLIHEYFGVSYSIVWETVKNDLPSFKRKIEQVLEELQRESSE